MKKNTTRKTTLIIGFNDKDAKKQLLSDEKINEIIAGCIAEYYEGATFSDCTGIYKGMPEKSKRVEVLFSTEKKDAALCEYLKKALNQECVYIEVEEVAARFA